MADDIFENPRLASIYDALDGERNDLAFYVDMARRFDAKSVLDVGCGTGSLAVLLADKGYSVVGVDPADASLDVAREKATAAAIPWVHGFVSDVAQSDFDLATMTGNASQAVVGPDEWRQTLVDVFDRLRVGGRFVFETRDPERRVWEEWGKANTLTTTRTHLGDVTHWNDVLDITGPLVTFRWTWEFENGDVMTSDSTLRFRSQSEVESGLHEAGFVVEDVLDAPDRPGLEFMFVARRPVANDDGKRPAPSMTDT